MNRMKTIALRAMQMILPARVKRSILHVGFHIARPTFDEFAYYHAYAPMMEYGLLELSRRGFRPTTVVDVGAFKGDWSRMAKAIWPEASLIMVEPNSTAEVRKCAADLSATLVQDLLGSEDGVFVPFNVMGSGSSVLNERSGVPRKTETRVTKTLDSAVGSIVTPGMLKIDAQGYELEILRGGLNLMRKCEIVLLEVSTIEINAGAPLLHEVVAFMAGHGYHACDILEIHRRPLDRAMNQVDILFARRDSALFSDKRHFAF